MADRKAAEIAGTRQLQPPAYFRVHEEGNAERWTEWKARWMVYGKATRIGIEVYDVQVSILLTVIGPEAHAVYRTFTWDEEGDDQKLDKVLKAFDDFFEPRKNIAFERYRFNMRGQEVGESFEQYVTALRQLAQRCAFNTITEDEILRDRILFGIKNQQVRERLLREANLSLTRTMDICRAAESTASQIKDINKMSDGTVHVIKKSTNLSAKTKNNVQFKTVATSASTCKRISDCKFCGKDHERLKERCPAWGKTCSRCHKPNHFAVKCRQLAAIDKTKINAMASQGSNIFTVQGMKPLLKDNQVVTLKLSRTANNYIRFQMDSGADCNVIPLHVYQPATGDKALEFLRPTQMRLFVYGQQQIKAIGKVTLELERGERKRHVEFQIIKGQEFHSLIGLQTCIDFGLMDIKDNDVLNPIQRPACIHSLTSDQILAKHPNVFRETVGHLDGNYSIRLNKSVPPVQHAPRQISVALRQPLRKELNKLVAQGIWAPVTEPTPWISSLVVVPKKDGSLRLCLDPKDLNKAIERENYPLPTIEEVATRMNGAKVFSILDVKQGFWHIGLDSVSSLATTFNTPFGRFRWCRMPFGISSASEVFQRRMHQVIEGLDGVEVIADDFLVYGRGTTREQALRDHDNNLEKFLERCKQHNLVLNSDKLKLRLDEVPFIGHVLTADGVRPSSDKVRAVAEMPIPKDRPGIRRFVGLVQYLAKFMPKLSDMTAPLRKLLKESNPFIWTSVQQKAFDSIKTAITKLPVLRFYDLKDAVTIQCDASKDGLGAVLLQCAQPIAYASRALTSAETRYAQIEKECLAIVFAAERFDHYIYGRDNVEVQSDHQPLEIICKKPLSAAPSRLQSMLMRLQRYNLKVVYKKGSEMILADTLSRAYCLSNSNLSNFVNHLESVESHSDVRQATQDNLRQETQKDAMLMVLRQMILDGWPSSKAMVPDAIKAYYNVRDEITLSNGILFKGNRIIVPRSLRKEMLIKGHGGPVGMEGYLRRLRESLYWPGMTAEARAFMTECDVCKSVQDTPSKEPMIAHDVPHRPWIKVAADICDFEGRNLLIVVDYFSNFVEVTRLNDMASVSVIRALSEIFARWGVPEIFVSDNGRQFVSAEFQNFAREWQFRQVTSSPLYPQSNGKVENAVRTIKRLFKKCALSGQSEFRALLDWRNTPSEGIGSSPAQRIMGRRCKTTLPISETLLQPSFSVDKDSMALQKQKQKQVRYYNRTCRKPRSFKTGEIVRMRCPGSQFWTPRRCVRKVAPRSFDIDVGGTIYRRNQRHMKFSSEVDRLSTPTMEDERKPSEENSVLDAKVEQKPTKDDIKDEDPVLLRRSSRIRTAPDRYGFPNLGRTEDVTCIIDNSN